MAHDEVQAPDGSRTVTGRPAEARKGISGAGTSAAPFPLAETP
jgi:hypothetical protein